MTDAEQRAAIIRDLDKHARETAAHVGRMEHLFRQLMEADEDAMPADDAITADNALHRAAREIPELRRVFAKQVRLNLAGPPPRLAIRSTDEPERLAIIARYPSGDLGVGDARRTDSGDGFGWRIRLTDDGQPRGSIGLCWDGPVDDVLDAANRHLNENGPWWTREEGRDDG